MKIDRQIEFDSPEFKATIDRVKDFSNYNANLEELKRLTSLEMDPNDIEFYYFNLAVFMPFITIPISKELWKENFFYRVRTGLDASQENIFTKAPFGYPPVANCRRNLRASPKNSSVFYCSNSLPTAILECKIDKLKVAYIGEWKLNLQNDISLMPYIGVDTEIAKHFPNYLNNIEKNIQFFSEKIGFDISPQMKAMISLAAESFCWATEHYTLSSWLSQYAFKLEQSDVIAYPSFMNSHHRLNFAFNTKVADQFSLENVYKIGTTAKHGELIAFDLLGVGERNLDSIVWRPRKVSDMERLRTLIDEG